MFHIKTGTSLENKLSSSWNSTNKKVRLNTFYCLFCLNWFPFHVALQLEEAVTQSSTMQCKVTQLETNLAAREQEILAYDAKYRKCVEKAKEVIKSIDPRIASGNLFALIS